MIKIRSLFTSNFQNSKKERVDDQNIPTALVPITAKLRCLGIGVRL